MTPIIHIRSFSTDQYELDKAFYANSYHIKPSKDKTVVDIGAHCGFFSFACLGVGFSKVYAVEPFGESFKILLKNMEGAPAQSVKCYNLAIYTESGFLKFNYPEARESIYDFSYPDIEQKSEGDCFVCPSVSLSDFLENVVDEEVIDLLKINIGYAEREILLASKLDRVQNICGESEASAEEFNKFKMDMSAKGFIDSALEPVDKDGARTRFFFSRASCNLMFNLK